MERKARCYVWVDASDCDPPHGLDLDWEHDAVKVKYLEEEFRTNGFNLDAPALVGYILNGRIQLLSGTHRHMAAEKLTLNCQLPSGFVLMWKKCGVRNYGQMSSKTFPCVNLNHYQSKKVRNVHRMMRWTCRKCTNENHFGNELAHWLFFAT